MKAAGATYQIDYGEFEFAEGDRDERKARLDTLAVKSNDRFAYVYDFGDRWLHTVVVERQLPDLAVPDAPVCVGGARACPPEDCGGVHGYRDLRRILANPKHKEFVSTRLWAGSKFDPLAFDVDDVNNRLSRYRKTGRLSQAVLPDVRMS